MFCKQCGKEIVKNARFCPNCGQNQHDTSNIASDSNVYCIHCGKEIRGSALFCIYCGKKQAFKETTQGLEPIRGAVPNQGHTAEADAKQDSSENVIQEHSPTFGELAHELGALGKEFLNYETKTKTRNDTVCPFCKEGNCQPTQKITMESSHKNYKWGSGCCGMFLLGPFGLLCGLCGAGSHEKATSDLWWTCLKCGKQHIALADALKKWDATISQFLPSSFCLGIIFMIFRWLELGEISFVVELFTIAVPIAWLYIFHQGFSDELGEPLVNYLTPDQKKKSLGTVIGNIAIILIIGLLGVSILENILGI